MGNGSVYSWAITQREYNDAYYACYVIFGTSLEDYDPSTPLEKPFPVTYSNVPYTDAQCQSNYGGAKFLPGLTTSDISLIGSTPLSVAGGACSAVINDGVAACTDSGCWVDVTATSTGDFVEILSDMSGDPVNQDMPDYLTPVSECTTGSCITIDGQIYEVDQDAIDQGTISIIGGSTGGGGDDGDGDTGGGDDGGGDGGSGGDGDGSGGSGGDGSGGGSGGSGGSGGDGSGGDGGGDGSSPWGGEGGYDGFGGEADHTARLDDAKDRYALAVADIQSEVASLFSINAGGGGGGCTSSAPSASAFGVTIDMDFCRFIGPALPVIKPAVLFVAAAFALFILLGSATGRRS